MYGGSKIVSCRAFSASLKDAATSWFSCLRLSSITNFLELCKSFITHLQSSIKHKKKTINLLSIKQKPDESIRAFVSRFNKESLDIKDLDEAMTHMTMSNGLWDMELIKDLARKSTKNMADLLERCNEFANMVAVLQAQKASEGKNVKKRSAVDDRKEDKRIKTDHRHEKTDRPQSLNYTPLNTSHKEILMQI
ncbi:uncharacterized protein LOC122655195 [Telopea speciosissima]|uniref:uncharacterized protein LOC122655195 n=1 Tax=Telopea speciosissima TaxID=54955 RepID=UPI001CC6268C|nr:uncharacterized protein LOC122655195 [Telopea speciosissima]